MLWYNFHAILFFGHIMSIASAAADVSALFQRFINRNLLNVLEMVPLDRSIAIYDQS